MTNDFTAPDGWVATQISEDVIVLKRKDEPKEPKEPQGRSKTWEEFCERHDVNRDDICIDSDSNIMGINPRFRCEGDDRNMIPQYVA